MTITSDLEWIALVPADILPSSYEETAAMAARDAAIRQAVAARIGSDELHVKLVIDDPGRSPLEALDIATELAGLREILQSLPATVVPAEWDQRIAEGLAATLASVDVGAGRPPVYVSDVIHCLREHPRDIPPVPGPRDLETLQLFEQLCATTPRIHATLIALRQPLSGPIAGRVQSWHHFTSDALPTHLQTVEAVRGLIAEVDAERLERGIAHRCPRWGGSPCAALDPVPSDVPWTLDWPLTGNGRPVRAANAWAPA